MLVWLEVDIGYLPQLLSTLAFETGSLTGSEGRLMTNKALLILSAAPPNTVYSCAAFRVGSEDSKWEHLAYALGYPASSTSLITEDGDEGEKVRG